MMKKDYQKPIAHAVKIQTCRLLEGSGIMTSTVTNGDTNVGYQGGEVINGRSRSFSVWDDNWADGF